MKVKEMRLEDFRKRLESQERINTTKRIGETYIVVKNGISKLIVKSVITALTILRFLMIIPLTLVAMIVLVFGIPFDLVNSNDDEAESIDE